MTQNQIEIISQDQREIELLEKNRKVNLQKLFTPEGMDLIIAEIQKEVADFSADISTKKGRAEIISMAAKVAKCKAPIKNLAAELKEESRRLIDGVNSQWNRYEAAMDTLRDQIRKPVDEIIENVKKILDFDNWGEFQFAAENAAKEVLENLENLHRQKEEQIKKDQELEQLRAEAAERARKDHEAAIAAEAARKAKFTAEMEAAKKAKELREAAEREKLEAEQARLKIEEEKKAAEEFAEKEYRKAKFFSIGLRSNGGDEMFFAGIKICLKTWFCLSRKQFEIEFEELEFEIKTEFKIKTKEDAEKAAADAVKKERERVAEEKRLADLAAEKLAANKKHCAKIEKEAISAVYDILEKYQDSLNWQAESIIKAIAKSEVPHVQINY